jgi:phage shock protein PspC (stress-responsive transcriptional regulator)
MNQTPDQPAAADAADAAPPANGAPAPESPAGPAANPTGPRRTRDEILDFGRLRRTSVDAKAGGVAGGLARHFDIDPVIVRVLFVVSAFFGIGILAYGALWLLVPADNAEKAPIGLDDSTRSVVVMIIGALTLIGLVGAFGGGTDLGGVVFLGLIAIGVVIYLNSRDKGRGQAPYSGYGSSADPAMAYAGPEARAALAAEGGQPLDPNQSPPHNGAGGYAPPPPGYRPPPPRAPNPRKRGPVLFGFTAALLLFALGLLGVADVAGTDVPQSAYPALAVAIIGVVLVVGAWYGRAGGLIALGLVASMSLAASTGVENFEGAKTVSPASADLVMEDYKLAMGELVVDLSTVSDQDALAGREINIKGGAGHIVVVLPQDVDARVNATVNGPGNINIGGEDFGGVENSQTWFHDTSGSGTVTINAELGVGEIEVRTS